MTNIFPGGATFISYFFAGVAALLSALCYAEFGARVPKAGSAYTYTYVTVGEFWAFLIGWNIILEHLLGAASVARALSGSVDTLFNGAIQNWTMSTIGRSTHKYKVSSSLMLLLSLLLLSLLLLFVIAVVIIVVVVVLVIDVVVAVIVVVIVVLVILFVVVVIVVVIVFILFYLI